MTDQGHKDDALAAALQEVLDRVLVHGIAPRWISVTQAMQYAPALGRKKILRHIDAGDFYALLDGGEWVIDRLTIDVYFEKKKKEREDAIAAALAKVSRV